MPKKFWLFIFPHTNFTVQYKSQLARPINFDTKQKCG